MTEPRRDPIHDSLESGILLVDALATVDLSDAAREATARHDFPDHLTVDDIRTKPRIAAAAIASAVDDRRLVEEILWAASKQTEHRATLEATRLLGMLRDEAASIGRLDWKCDGPMDLLEAALDFVSCSVWFDDDELVDRIATEFREVAPRSRPDHGAAPTYGMGG